MKINSYGHQSNLLFYTHLPYCDNLHQYNVYNVYDKVKRGNFCRILVPEIRSAFYLYFSLLKHICFRLRILETDITRVVQEGGYEKEILPSDETCKLQALLLNSHP